MTDSMQRIRQDVQSICTPMPCRMPTGMVKLDAMENPTDCRQSYRPHWVNAWGRSPSTVTLASV